jgi:hypothetical protein
MEESTSATNPQARISTSLVTAPLNSNHGPVSASPKPVSCWPEGDRRWLPVQEGASGASVSAQKANARRVHEAVFGNGEGVQNDCSDCLIKFN